ncbi:hypothetical protein MLD38_006238 [Melastoma candidum]|uniref:Uncharacterized protein n=1 Tax=Melastoma candidum TaxID=119954 RepID=A0ACB9RMC4_9MYRT|nr:hypothetical protein MLD38_006238 [Melastoma candidum]
MIDLKAWGQRKHFHIIIPVHLHLSGRHDGGGGPLCELSDLMTHLPIKRGLSRHYSGKSQSFTSLASVRSLEDLAKKENSCMKRLKLLRG